MATPVNVLRLEAARNTGITAEFRRRFGRDFSGTVADYGNLTPDQQFRLTDEMFAIIRANPADFTPGQVELARSKTKAYTAKEAWEEKTKTELALEGAVEGAKAAGAITRTALVEVARLPGQVVGAAYEGVAGESLGKTIGKIAVVAVIGLGLYGAWLAKPFRDETAARYRASRKPSTRSRQ